MAYVVNLFDDFEEPLRAFFQLDLDTQDKAIKLFNDRGPHLGIGEFARVTELDTSDDPEYILQTLAILIRERYHDHEKFTNMLNNSKLPQDIKSNVVNFTTSLDETGKTGFKIRYAIDARSINEPTLTYIRHTVFLKAVEDIDKTIVCHTPVIRLEFSFNNKKGGPEYAYMSIEQLQIMIDSLSNIHQDSIKTAEAYKTKQHPDFLIVGNK